MLVHNSVIIKLYSVSVNNAGHKSCVKQKQGGEEMANISLRDMNKTYEGNVTAIEHLNLEIKDKEFIVLVGPSGYGKSTTLRMK